MKTYTQPELKVTTFEAEAVLLKSGTTQSSFKDTVKITDIKF